MTRGLYKFDALAGMAGGVAGLIPVEAVPDGSRMGDDYRPRSRGKRKPPRHGQKLKSCRNKISKRVRRKHRRAS